MAVNDVLINGVALNDFGLTDTNTINGYGINTYGFLWGCGAFWLEPYYSNGTTVSTSYTLCPAISTIWTAVTAGASTTWTLFTTTDQNCF